MGWGGYDQLCCQASPKLLLGLDLGLGCDNNLISKDGTHLIEVVGSESKQVHSKIYLVDLIDMFGQVHTVWGYGTAGIMTSSVPECENYFLTCQLKHSKRLGKKKLIS